MRAQRRGNHRPAAKRARPPTGRERSLTPLSEEAAHAADLIALLRDARSRTLALVDGLDGDQLLGPQLDVVNPLLWEIGHLAWFHEHFVLRGLDGSAPLWADTDTLYDSARVPHATRWSLPLPSLADTLDYMERVQTAL